MQQTIWAVIPAAGKGTRLGEPLPKQYLVLDGHTVLARSVNCLLDCDAICHVVVALAEDDDRFQSLQLAAAGAGSQGSSRLTTVVGGNSRAQSVLNAILSLKGRAGPDDFVLVHDAARPLLHPDDLQLLIESVSSSPVGGILAHPVADTLKQAKAGSSDGNTASIQATLPRDNVWAAQTPQMFRYSVLSAALETAMQQALAVTDEASAVEAAGFQPMLVRAGHSNLKITYPGDVAMAAFILSQRDKNNETAGGSA